MSFSRKINCFVFHIILVASIFESATSSRSQQNVQFSQHYINLTKSFNFQLKIPIQYFQLDLIMDYNSKMQLLTMKMNKNIWVTDVSLFKYQYNIDRSIGVLQNLFGTCNKLKVDLKPKGMSSQLLKNLQLSHQQLNKLLLSNFVFSYVFKPIYLIDNTELTQKFKIFQLSIFQTFNFRNKQKGQSYSQSQKRQKDEYFQDLKQKVKFIIMLNKETNQLERVYTSKQMNQRVVINWSSKQKQALDCQIEHEMKTITGDQLVNGQYQGNSQEDIYNNYQEEQM